MPVTGKDAACPSGMRPAERRLGPGPCGQQRDVRLSTGDADSDLWRMRSRASEPFDRGTRPARSVGGRSACRRATAAVAALLTVFTFAASVPAAGADSRPLPSADVHARIDGLKLVDYFPSQNAWDYMWTRFDLNAIKQDFARLQALHANAVRIIPRVSAFGYPQPSQLMLDRLHSVISTAESYGLRVEITMFDGFDSYTDVAGSEQWAEAILAPYAGDPNIAYIDLRNEINREPSSALAWAQQMIPFTRDLMRGVPLTASVTINEGNQNLQSVLDGLGSVRPDFYDVHYYAQDGQAYARLRDVQRLVAPAPVFVGETGYSTRPDNASVPGLPQGAASEEAYQEYYLRSVNYAASVLGIPTPAPWILDDFAPGAWPGIQDPDNGLFRTDGSPKPVVGSETSFFGTGAISTDFNQGFERGMSVQGLMEPQLWREYQPSGVTATFAQDQSVAHSGDASASISQTGGTGWGCASLYLVPISDMVAGTTYTAGVYARGAALTGSNYLSLSWFDADGTYLSESTSSNLPAGDSGWAQLSVSAQPPANAAFVQLHLKSCMNQGTVWWDDVSLSPVTSFPGQPTAGSSGQGTATAGASGLGMTTPGSGQATSGGSTPQPTVSGTQISPSGGGQQPGPTVIAPLGGLPSPGSQAPVAPTRPSGSLAPPTTSQRIKASISTVRHRKPATTRTRRTGSRRIACRRSTRAAGSRCRRPSQRSVRPVRAPRRGRTRRHGRRPRANERARRVRSTHR